MRTALWITTLFLVGCGGPEVTRITGSVLADGQPVAGNDVSVIFWPDTDLGLGVMAAYSTDPEGNFMIRPDPEQAQGRAGDYKVVIYRENSGLSKSLMGGAQKPMELKRTVAQAVTQTRIPTIYGDDRETPLRAKIRPGENDLEPFDLQNIKRQPPR